MLKFRRTEVESPHDANFGEWPLTDLVRCRRRVLHRKISYFHKFRIPLDSKATHLIQIDVSGRDETSRREADRYAPHLSCAGWYVLLSTEAYWRQDKQVEAHDGSMFRSRRMGCLLETAECPKLKGDLQAGQDNYSGDQKLRPRLLLHYIRRQSHPNRH